jgi:NTE family protein
MTTLPLQQFLDDLDNILDSNPKAVGNRDSRMKWTRDLLNAADKLLAERPPLQKEIQEGKLRQRISGYTTVHETYLGQDKERAVVDLVQQGGTMLGIGLLGYTYIMEKAGVRFRSMAGTSAGAINTLLVAALPDKIYTETSLFDPKDNAVKSEYLAYLVANEDFGQFLDRDGFIGRIQGWMIRNIKVAGKILTVLKYLLPFFIIAASFGIYHFFYKHFINTANHLTETQVNNWNFITGTLGIIVIVLLLFLAIFSLLKKNMGINRGEVPYQWLKKILETDLVKIHTTKDLMERKKIEPAITYNPPIKPEEKITYKDPRMVFITANLTHNRIVKFPENSGDYWHKDYKDFVTPAAFVRASMSLPFIFYTVVPSTRHIQLTNGKPAPEQAVDLLARFVDGGLLSNFPIREFHTPAGVEPRYPTFGVLLGDLPKEPGKNTAEIERKFWSLSVFKYVLSFISTFRNFYDADFLRTHDEFKMLVTSVDTKKFNSLDFGMKLPTKIDLFAAGAKTAIDHLEKFDWTTYLKVREGKL